MDLTWLIVAAAAGAFALRTAMIARRLKAAAKEPVLVDVRALREAKASLVSHRSELDAAIASPKVHLASAKRLARLASSRSRAQGSNLDRMVEEFLPERRL